VQVSYRGHEITVVREKCLAGYPMVYYGIFRESDDFECTSGCSAGEDKIHDFVRYLKARVDEELASPNPWGENDSAHPMD